MVDFDEAAGIDRNLALFLDEMSKKDAEMGDILRTVVADLRGAKDDVTRKSARSNANVTVVARLDDLAGSEEKAE